MKKIHCGRGTNTLPTPTLLGRAWLAEGVLLIQFGLEQVRRGRGGQVRAEWKSAGWKTAAPQHAAPRISTLQFPGVTQDRNSGSVLSGQGVVSPSEDERFYFHIV